MADNMQKLLGHLKQASDECWSARVALYEVGLKHAPLCIQLLLEMRHTPKLVNSRIEKRMQETGLEPIHPDFWSPDMIIALAEHFQSLEDVNASA